MTVIPLVLVWFVVSLQQPAAKASQEVGFSRLLREVCDLDGLTRWPDPPFITRQFSSRNRLSVSPRNPETWFAEPDRGYSLYDGLLLEDAPYYRSLQVKPGEPDGVLPKGTRVGLVRQRSQGDYIWVYATAADGGPIDGRIPQGFIQRTHFQPNPDGHVLAEMDGPGCLVRIWSSNPSEAGAIRIFLDDNPVPVISAPLADLLGGAWETTIAGRSQVPFSEPIAAHRGQAWTLHFPIPFRAKCRVVAEKPGLAYHITYRTYANATVIPTFSWDLWAAHASEITALGDYLARRPGARASPIAPAEAGAAPRSENPVLEATLEPDAQINFRTYRGAGCVHRLVVRVTSDRPVETLRSLVLTAVFDDARVPQIHCPLGDFFGTSPGANPYQSEPLAVSADMTLTSQWRMPFSRNAVFSLTNLGRHRVAVSFETSVPGFQWSEDSMHFHAKWQAEPALSSRPFRDWTWCRLRGQGVFVGTMLSVMNPVSSWWGDGDDKIYVDGERFPGWFGTATDEHFGFAHGHQHVALHPFYNLTLCEGPGHRGRRSMNRFHFLDRIPFNTELRFDLEARHWSPDVRIAYAATCYWYARPGSTDGFPPLDKQLLRRVPVPPTVKRIAGAWEGEQLRVVRQSSGFHTGIQEMSESWSNGALMQALPSKRGEWVELAVPISHKGKQRLILHLAQGPQYGELRFDVNGDRVTALHRGYRAGEVRPAQPLELGTFDLEPGTLTLRIESTDADPQAVFPRFGWGLDAVVWQPVK